MQTTNTTKHTPQPYIIDYCKDNDRYSIAFDSLVLCLSKSDLIAFHRQLEQDSIQYQAEVDNQERIFVYNFGSQKIKAVLNLHTIAQVKELIISKLRAEN